MILFAETSALVKLDVDESGSAEMLAAAAAATAVAVARIAWGEAMSAFARRARAGCGGASPGGSATALRR